MYVNTGKMRPSRISHSKLPKPILLLPLYRRNMLLHNPPRTTHLLSIRSLPLLLLDNRHLRKLALASSMFPPPIKSTPHKSIHTPIPPHPLPEEIISHQIRLLRHLACHFFAIVLYILCCGPTCVDNVRASWIRSEEH